MYQLFTVIREAEDSLSRNVYRFWLNDYLELHLDGFSAESRPTKRHHYKSTASWERLLRGGNTIKQKPEVPEDVVEEALALTRPKIVFVNKGE